MKKIKFLLALCVMMLSTAVAKADLYTDGLLTMIQKGMAGVNTEAIGMQLKQSGSVDEDYFKGDFAKDMAEILAPYYRDNMNETEFKAMIEFYSSPAFDAVAKKITTASNGASESVQQELQGVIMSLVQGETPEDLKYAECDAKLKAAIQEFNKVSDVESMVLQIRKGMDQMFDQMTANASEDEKEQAKTLINNIFNYLAKNMNCIMHNTLVKSDVSVDDLNEYNKIAQQPFYANYMKANKALAGDAASFTTKLMEKFADR